ncbi:hypothetical protein [Rhodoferax sp.]|uniref:hypothetical protein n=1 Tax=Rhodoferax sp. TaxID=50421 RepID=UPI0025E3B8BB|nr:hypothetical protein [Rhodoferax sp.]MCM2296043.1 hypothetical protein [Rhodoferax sp.]
MFTTNNGGAPGVNTPIEKAAGAINTNGLHTDTNSADFRSHGAVNQAHDGKAIANQIARLALAGHAVHKGQSGDYLVSKYGMSRYCQDFAELQAFAVKLGVNHE